MSKQMKRNNSVPEEIDRLPEIQMKRKEASYPPDVKKSNGGPGSKNLDDSFKKYQGLYPIREDRDDEFCKYNDDFEPHEEVKLSAGKLLEAYMNAKSAEPHLHKSKA